MNKQRRAALAKALPMLEQAAALLAKAREQISTVHDEEEEAYGNLSDGQRDGDLGSEMEQAVSDLSDALDTLDNIDIATVAKSVSNMAHENTPDIAAAVLNDREMQERRHARLAPWAKELIERAEKRAETADIRLAEAFRDSNPENAHEIVIDDYDSPLKGKVIPAERLRFPGLGVDVAVSRDGKFLEIRGYDMGCLTTRGQASNSLNVRLERSW